MDDYKSIVSYQTQDHGYIRIKLRQLLDERQVTRNKLRTLTGVKYDVINRYYQAERVQMVDLISSQRSAVCSAARSAIFWNTARSRKPVRKTNNQKSAGNRSVPGYIDALYCFGCLTANTCIAMPRPVTPQNTRCMTRACFGPIFLAAACV